MTITDLAEEEKKEGSPRQSPAAGASLSQQDGIFSVKSSESAYYDASSRDGGAGAAEGEADANEIATPPPSSSGQSGGDVAATSTAGVDQHTSVGVRRHRHQHHHHRRNLTDHSQEGVVGRGMALMRGMPQDCSDDMLNADELNELRTLLPTIRSIRSSWETAQTSSSAAVCGPPLPLPLTNADPHNNTCIPMTATSNPASSPSHAVSPRTRASTAGFSIAALDDNLSVSDCSTEDNYGVADDTVRLSRDIYSILFVTNPRRHPFVFALMVFAFQIFVLALVCIDVIDLQNTFNPLDIPAGVNAAVRAAQFIAILVSVATQDDLITAINWLHNGYPSKTVHLDEGGVFWQWVLAVSLRFFQGSLCLATTFILIMQANDVVGLFLDFLALTFISTLDDIMFALARDGYFSHKLKKEAKYVMSVRVAVSPSRFFRPLAFAFLCSSFIIGWCFVVYGQATGKYIRCNTISVQFGDAFQPDLAHFSGIYAATSSNLGRPIYVEQKPQIEAKYHGQAIFGYCHAENAWTFSFADKDGDKVDPCNWVAKTVETETFDISTIPSSEWNVLSTESVEVPFTHFSLVCNDCEHQTKDACSNAGQCVSNACVCNDDRFGTICQYEKPCETVEVDTSKEPFVGDWSETFDLLQLAVPRIEADKYRIHSVKVYDRPVYSSHHNDGSYHLILFTGRRWVLINSDSAGLRNGLDTDWQDVVEWLEAFHGYYSEYSVSYISSPTDVFTPTDKVSPLESQWFGTKSTSNEVDLNEPQPTVLLCGVCNDRSNPCGNQGVCRAGSCQCKMGTFGSLCQVSGFILCSSLQVQFGDALVSNMGGFTGIYDRSSQTINGRSVYVERSRRSAVFAYCQQEKAYTFTIVAGLSHNSTSDLDPCDWTAKSTQTESYDITAVAKDWLIRRNSLVNEGVQMKSFKLSCNDCDRKESVGITPRSGKSQGCKHHGFCTSDEAPIGTAGDMSSSSNFADLTPGKRCRCDDGRYGPTCEFRMPCDRLAADVPSRLAGKIPSEFTLLLSDDGFAARVNYRPVYVNEVSPGSFLVLLFTGVRWIATRTMSHPPLANGTSIDALSAYLTHDFHGFFSSYSVSFISEAADVETLVRTATPVGLSWYEPKTFDDKQADISRPIATGLLTCAYCDGVDYNCYNSGTCNANGECECLKGSFGRSCQMLAQCQSLTVNFGEKVGEDQIVLGEFSSDFFLSGVTRSYRPVYTSQNGVLAYCDELGSWTFTLWDKDKKKNPELQDPCARWRAISTFSNTFDVMSLSNWFTVGADGITQIPLSFVSFSCNYNRVDLGGGSVVGGGASSLPAASVAPIDWGDR